MSSDQSPWRIHPRRYFPIRSVLSYDESGNRWRSRQTEGTQVDDNDANVQIIKQLCEKAWTGLSLTKLPVRFCTAPPALAAICTGEDGNRTLEISVDLIEDAGIQISGDAPQGPVDGCTALLRLIRVFAEAALELDDWAAVSAVVKEWRTFSDDKRTALTDLLVLPRIDSGHIFSRFLAIISDDNRRTESGEDESRWLYRWTTWLFGQNRIDLPYNRDEIAEVIGDKEIDPDDARLLLFQTVRQYEKPVEKDNAERTYRQVAWDEEELIFGRMSRAFHNQALLFAHARYVSVTDGMEAAAQSVVDASQGWPELRPAADRIKLLVRPGSETPLTELAGAIDHLEELCLVTHRAKAQKALADRRAQVETAIPDPGADKKGAEGVAAVTKLVDAVLVATGELRNQLLEAPRRPAAYIIMSQRPSPTGSHLLAKINQGEEPYLGKADNLKQLVVLAGDRVYSSPDYVWLEYTMHWIEAIPLFIKERIKLVDGVETAETVIDQKGMEQSFREGMADPWARNLAGTELSGYAALARAMIFEDNAFSVGIDRTADFPRAWRVSQEGNRDEVADLATAIALAAEDNAAAVNAYCEKNGSDRAAALQLMIQNGSASGFWTAVAEVQAGGKSWAEAAKQVSAKAEKNDKARYTRIHEQILPWTDLPRRPLPTLHVLTTQSANMTNGYIRSWLEESMALYNVVQANGLESAVRERMASYRSLSEKIGAMLIGELGLDVEVDTIMAREGVSRSSAIGKVSGANRMVQSQLSLLAVLNEAAEELGVSTEDGLEPTEVDTYLEEHRDELRGAAVKRVVSRNAQEFDKAVAELRKNGSSADTADLYRKIIDANEEYRTDLETFIRFEAREGLLVEWEETYPDLRLSERRETWLRRHGALALTTARKEVVTENGLAHLTLDPKYFFQATGGGKRYNLIYTPSRVDLGPKERESVETWSQWVGGIDREAAQVGRRVYGMINKAVKRFDSLAEPEVLKTGENASMASHFAYSNAMALMVNATGRGDVEELGDQMSLREDRKIHPAGEGYGGYCVPKDGLFLEFVLTLSESVKLGQLGVPEEHQAAVAALAKDILLKRNDFDTELEWENWAEGLLADQETLSKVFTVRKQNTDNGEIRVPVFQITRLAQVLNNLGQPPLEDHRAVVKALAARWGIHTMIAGAEHVNRFMPFYKTWLTYDALRAARERNSRVAENSQSVIVLSAEYKPNTQDGRFAVGMRKYEIYTGTDDHLRFSLGSEAGALASLMFDGWDAVAAARGVDDSGIQHIVRQWGVDPTAPEAADQLRTVFPGYASPGELRLVSPMGLSTQDVLRYTSDTKIEQVADGIRLQLLGTGLTEEDITSNMSTYGPKITNWARMRGNPEAERLEKSIGGKIHALALAELGPQPSYEFCLQGADVFDVGISHRQVMELIDEPVHLRDLMIFGRPFSALVIVDGGSGARRRAMSRLDVMRWFAACEQIGRESIYRSIGLGEGTIEEWRTQMRQQKDRAEQYRTAMLDGETEILEGLFNAIRVSVDEQQEALLALEEEERLTRFKRDTDRGHVAARLLGEIARMTDSSELTFAHWLALGGMFLIDGCTEDALMKQAEEFAAAGAGSGVSDDDLKALITLARPEVTATFRQEGNVESSNKATEEVTSIALDTRKELAARARQMMAERNRARSFDAALAELGKTKNSIDTLVEETRNALGDAQQFDSNENFGRVVALTRALGDQLISDYAASAVEAAEMKEHLHELLSGREIEPEALRPICGGYEDLGAIPRLAQNLVEKSRRSKWSKQKRQEALETIADLAEFVDTIHALSLTLSLRQTEEDEVDTAALWRTLASFFAETLNDHFYEYRPWAYSRGIGFEEYTGDALYELADRHHRWLYAYLRNLIVTRTEMNKRSGVEQDALLGRLTENDVIVAIGATGETEAEEKWRAYNQLREIAFIRNDGFPLPQVFDGFDPSLIDAETRVNIVCMYPVGRTHISRIITEGPTLARELVTEGQQAANIIITRLLKVNKPRLLVEDGHLYVDEDTYVTALQKHWGLTESGARALAKRDMTPKGVRIAVRFSRPVMAAVVFPLHGNPVYTEGLIEELGLPYGSQSRFHTWTTYDKAKYPDIFNPETGVLIPDEIDWLQEWTGQREKADVIHEIRHGREGTDFTGLEPFSVDHQIIMVKDAAESGGRGQKAFVLRSVTGEVDEDAMAEAVEFLYQISLVHNVAVQDVVIATPEAWATEEFMQWFMDKQILEWHRPIIRGRKPETPLFGSIRVIFSTDKPQAANRDAHWHPSHWITLNSTQLITNVGRGGTLDYLRPSCVQEKFRADIFAALENAGRKIMEAMAAYEARAGKRYEKETGFTVGKDLTGVSYGVPRYLMLDFLLRPKFSRAGRLVEVVPEVDDSGTRIGSQFILHDGTGRFVGEVSGWDVVLIEPNIGIGLWDRLSIREEEHERERAQATGEDMQWDKVGENARIVLRDLSQAGSEYIAALQTQHENA